jgi:FkbM family methyltransferase
MINSENMKDIKWLNVRFLNFRFDVPDIPSFIWQFKDIFVDEIYKFDSNSQRPIIYDCGANIGMSCLYFKLLYSNARVIAFEADPFLADILRNNLQKNGISNNVEIINAAVWIENGEIDFSRDFADGGSVYGTSNNYRVKAVRLRDFLEKENKVDMLKMDIEGAEYDVLFDCKDVLGIVENIFVEYHSWSDKDQKLSEILSILEYSGFRYYIENVSKRKHPLINQALACNMDLQLNIWRYRK